MKLRPGPRLIIGLDDSQPAFNLRRLLVLPVDEQLRFLLVPEERDQHGFETPEDMLKERGHRVRSLRNSATVLTDPTLAADAIRLAAALAVRRGRCELPNIANPDYMARVRNAFISHVMSALLREPAGTPMHTFTIIVEVWARTPEELLTFHRDDILDGLKAHLYRAGLADLDGWCVVGLHGEFRNSKRRFELHFHAIVVGEKCSAFEALADVAMFKGGRGQPIYRPVQGEDLVNLPRQVSYVFQGFWPTKYRNEPAGVDEGLRGRRRRIPDPYHAIHLLWLSRQRFTDLVWLHGVAIRNGRIERDAGGRG